MTRLLLDANIWNYICKAGVFEGFVRFHARRLVTLDDVIEQLVKAGLEILQLVIDGAGNGLVHAVGLTAEEENLRYALLSDHHALGMVDCGLLAVALSRRWSLVTCDKKLRNTADRLNVRLVNLDHLIDEAVDAGFMTAEEKVLVMQFVHK